MKPFWVGLALSLAGCASAPPALQEPSATGPAMSGAMSPVPAKPSPLAGEQRWLAELFKGTPVQVAGDADGSVRVVVPLRYAFAGEAREPLPPLHAVLARLALALQRQGSARLVLDAPEPGAPARALAMRQQLQALGIAGYRVQTVAAASPAAVNLRLAMPPPAIDRLVDPPAVR